MKNPEETMCIEVHKPSRNSSCVAFGDIVRNKMVAARHVIIELPGGLKENGIAIFECDAQGMPVADPIMILRGITVTQIADIYEHDRDPSLPHEVTQEEVEAAMRGDKAPVIQLASYNGKTVH